MNLHDSSVSNQDEQQLYLQHCRGVPTSSIELISLEVVAIQKKMNFGTSNMYKPSNNLFLPPGTVLNAYLLHLHGT